MTPPDFKKWPSIQRLSSEICWITEKIDGTNAVIYVSDNGDVFTGSRERWLTLDNANFGFAAWVQERKDKIVQLGPGYHYGEFHGKGINRGYGLQDRRFASFEYWRNDLAIDGVCVVPVLYTGEPTAGIIDETVEKLRNSGSVLHHGFMKPEGVVITFKEMNTAKFKRMCENDKIRKKQQAHP